MIVLLAFDFVLLKRDLDNINYSFTFPECSESKFGAKCLSDCIACYNGGTCDDRTGQCVCTSGFTGSQCQYGKSKYVIP